MTCAGGEDAVFIPCDRGFYANESGMVKCSPCSTGFYAPKVGAPECDECLPGSYGDVEGSPQCTPCGLGTYMPFLKSSACLECGMDRTTLQVGSHEETDCLCAQGLFFCKNCLPCPEGLVCPAGVDLPFQKAGYWASVVSEECGPDTIRVLKCRNGLQCPQGRLGQCAEGREGIACSNCKIGYFPVESGSCEPCGTAPLLPAIFVGLFAGLLLIVMLAYMQFDLSRQRLGLLSIGAVVSQLVLALQALGSIRQFTIDWDLMPVVTSFLELAEFAMFNVNLDFIHSSCLHGGSAAASFVGHLLVLPCAFMFLLAVRAGAKAFGRCISYQAVFNCSGVLMVALFNTLTLEVLFPFQCKRNPSEGIFSLLSNPGIFCFQSDEHWILLSLSVVGILAYPVAILTVAVYATVMYPAWIATDSGLAWLQIFKFLFGRFKPSCYFYSLPLLIRSGFVGLVPVACVSFPALQLVFMATILISSLALQVRLLPWRTKLANVADAIITALLLLFLVGVAPLLDVERAEAANLLQLVICIIMIAPFAAGIIFLGILGYGLLRRKTAFSIFFCHHKGGAGSLCRLMKIWIAKHSNVLVFLDSDQATDLDLIFDTIRAKTANLVPVLTQEGLRRIWCAGEIVTAYKNSVKVLPLICDDFVHFTDHQVEDLGRQWSQSDQNFLANHGISMNDVKETYMWLRSVPSLSFHRFDFAEQQEGRVMVFHALGVFF